VAHRHIHSRPDRNKTGLRNSGVAEANRRRIRHGWANTRLAKVYDGMKARCHDPKSSGYRYYGARGITVCEEWLADRSAFFAWAEANGYREGLQIDREKGHLGYSPENCRWVTQLVNQNNRSSNRRVTVGDETMSVADWARRIGISQRTIHARLDRGWEAERALSKEIFSRRCRPRTKPENSM
jgi:hypothetical protein